MLSSVLTVASKRLWAIAGIVGASAIGIVPAITAAGYPAAKHVRAHRTDEAYEVAIARDASSSQFHEVTVTSYKGPKVAPEPTSTPKPKRELKTVPDPKPRPTPKPKRELKTVPDPKPRRVPKPRRELKTVPDPKPRPTPKKE
jgi:hypothetical protein